MNEIQVFSNPEFSSIRAMLIDGNPWFVAHDVAAALGYGGGNPTSKALTDAIRRHVDPDDKRHMSYQEFQGRRNTNLESSKVSETATLNSLSHYGAYIINESGVYALIFGSKLQIARSFKHWVTSEVLPALRRQGSYTTPGAREAAGEITAKDRIKVTEILQRCPESRLRMLVEFLNAGGFDIRMPEKPPVHIPEPVDPAENEANQAHLRELLSSYGVREAAGLTGMPAGVISRYRSGKSRPRPERCRELIGALE